MNMIERVKLTLAVLFVISGITGYYFLDNQSGFVRIGIILLSIVIAVVLMWFTNTGEQFYSFAQASIAEVKKVVWPTRRETFQITGIVFALTIIMSLFLWIVDTILLIGLQKLMGIGG